MIKAIIFDMNGVIIDDEHIHEMAFKSTLAKHGIELDHRTYLEFFAGKTDKFGYENIAEKFDKKLPIDNLLKEKKKIYLEFFPENKKYYPGVIKLINILSNDFVLALTSSSTREEVNLVINKFGINDKFKITISAEDINKGKPNPEPYTITAKKIGLKPEECAVIEDSKSGVISAKAAGCYCIGITTTHSEEDLAEADIIVNDFKSINSNLIKKLAKKAQQG